jgi:hypothetical protein
VISFTDATDAELRVMRDAVDAVTLTWPGLIHEDESWCEIVHAVMNEIHARRHINQLAAEQAV